MGGLCVLNATLAPFVKSVNRAYIPVGRVTSFANSVQAPISFGAFFLRMRAEQMRYRADISALALFHIAGLRYRTDILVDYVALRSYWQM
jgi:hypothetical protein